ncbi:MAG: hypothetical protein WCF65_03065 [Parachlamydiaceae bacterium]
MFSSISPKRLLLYLMLAGLIPILAAWFSFSSEIDQINNLQGRLWGLQDQAFTLDRKQSANIAIRSHFHDTDHFYIDKSLETLAFLEPEIESLQQMLNNPNFPDDENIKKRLEMLSGQENSMVFTEGVVQSTPIFQEVTESLAHPVEVNVNDIQEILCHVEGVPLDGCTPPPHRPQLIVLEFKIDKKSVSENNEVFLLNLKLLKREFL